MDGLPVHLETEHPAALRDIRRRGARDAAGMSSARSDRPRKNSALAPLGRPDQKKYVEEPVPHRWPGVGESENHDHDIHAVFADRPDRPTIVPRWG